MEIRKCNISDINPVYNLICELKEKEFDYKKFKQAFYSKINNNKNYYILCIDNEQVIGFLSLAIDYQLHHANKVATVEELIVTTKSRSNGAGKLLIENAINYAKEKDCEVIELTSVFSRERAHNFYMKNGFNKGSYKFKKNL